MVWVSFPFVITLLNSQRQNSLWEAEQQHNKAGAFLYEVKKTIQQCTVISEKVISTKGIVS